MRQWLRPRHQLNCLVQAAQSDPRFLAATSANSFPRRSFPSFEVELRVPQFSLNPPSPVNLCERSQAEARDKRSSRPLRRREDQSQFAADLKVERQSKLKEIQHLCQYPLTVEPSFAKPGRPRLPRSA